MNQSNSTLKPYATIKNNERVFLCGMTGSGKTTMARYLARGLKRLIVLDPKGSLANWNCIDPKPGEIKKFLRGEPGRFRFVPPLADAGAWFDDAAELAFAAGDCVIYIDEMYGVIPPGSRASDLFSALWTRGREYGIGAWSASQRPAWIPLFALSESDHYFVFRLRLDEDKNRMASFMGDRVLDPISHRHGFYYMGASDETPRYNAGLKL